MIKNNVVARLTAERSDSIRIIVEVHTDATFMHFYEWFTQQGRRWSTKKHTRFGSRNDGLPSINAHLRTPGLEPLKTHLENLTLTKFTDIKVRIFKKRVYDQLIHASFPDAIVPAAIIKVDGKREYQRPTPVELRKRKVYLPSEGWVWR